MNLLEITQPIPINIKYFYNIDYLCYYRPILVIN